MMRNPLINIAVEATRVATVIINRAMKRMDTIKIAEKQPNDFVTEVDQKVELAIIEVIRKAYPSHAILGEEGGESDPDDESEYQWIIDPIDGTRNFIHGFPHFAISIAIAHKGRIEHGVIYDPLRQELFTATRGKGAFLNQTRIRVAERKQVADALIGTGFAYRHTDKESELPGKLYNAIFSETGGDIRRAGAAVLDLAYVACGRLDAFWEMGLKIWDLAAGTLLVKEAGGFVTDIDGSDNFLKSGHVICANPALLRQLLKTIKPCL